MPERVERNGPRVSQILAESIENEAVRDDLQTQIDNRHCRHRNQPHNYTENKAFLEAIGYIIAEGSAGKSKKTRG